MSNFELILYAFLMSSLVMTVLWYIQLKTHNAGTVDVAWSFLTPLVGSWLILFDTTIDNIRQYLIILLAIIWGFRLGIYLYNRVMNETEDGRYRYFREYAGNNAPLVMFLFFQVQASWTVLFALPFWAASKNTSADIGILDMLGIAIWIIAIGGEILSDKQLKKFKQDASNKGQVCQSGLWKYSRHPNYFFEWLHWLAYVLIGFYSSYWWLTVTGVLVMYVFITQITGIPFTEKQSVRSKGALYKEYQKTTSKFFPLPRSNPEKS
jgi:steroid 5-alpha reductase family enzyme